MEEPRSLERRGLRLNLVGTVLMTALGVVFFFLTRSEAVLLDGLFSMVSFAVGLLSMKVARLVRRPDDELFHFGYAAYEPFVNLGKALLILFLSAFAVASAAEAVLRGGRPISAGVALAYALVAAAGCFAVAVRLRKLASRSGSSLVAVDARNWTIDGLISAAVAVAFVVAVALQGTRLEPWLPYVDPLVVLLLVVGSLPVPIAILRENWSQLVGKAPPEATQEPIRRAIDDYLAEDPAWSPRLRLLEMGRVLYVHLSLVGPPERSVAELDRIREKLLRRMPAREHLFLDVLFMADAGWAASTPGPTPPAGGSV